ncbi:Enoyl-CoA hydratase/isomerase [Segniliparus rotundus DSM 44985]|uniref:Enoyl-CoA hydratase/isomerase n=1 Tax=Segniliparus rotundus (strain ATCC BAA-972 / CDC 1076 / CIP 108378 / DSM 44985 / JCM 13578) TaxID=640132 RepID=D6ZD68_SEGRD|nr:enoyl-CoA hydratase [Segniliparus rotundus]ADG99255.1 Enoyl-CoA hydratase/isomerase [Segniliparus rotundus DSM 44985]
MIGVTRDGHAAVIELQRPQKRNAIDVPTIKALTQAFEEAAADEDVRVVVVTGQGSTFCSGADLSNSDPVEGPKVQMKLLRAITQTPVPVLAAVNGPVIGAGVQIALACDLRVLDPEAFVQIPTARMGVAYDPESIRRLVAVAGGTTARTLLYSAEKITAEQALACGFANKIGDRDAALAWAKHIGGLAPLSLKLTKRILREDFERPVAQELSDAAGALLFTEDVKEGFMAKLEKRPPVFQGK